VSKKSCIFGTAGHIDHGKTSLLKKLTGTNPDRLKEEQARGITIDLGFTFLENDKFQIGFVDVPGHEKLVKNMIAGATGFDACIFAVDAKEMIMPQTIEHANIVKSLGIENIIIVITKSDLLEKDELMINSEKIKQFFLNFDFKNIHFINLSIYDEESIEDLKKLIFQTAEQIQNKNSDLPFLLRVDRSFTVKGFGTVVTGTAISGTVFVSQELELLPKSIKTKVKGINVNNKSVKQAIAGQRVALNLNNLDKKDVKRGDLLVEENSLKYVNKFYAYIKVFYFEDQEVLIKHNKTYPIFIGTAHYNCKIIMLDKKEVKNNEEVFAVIKLDENYAPVCGEKFLIRGLSPQITIAGGEVLSIFDYSLVKKTLIDILKLIKNRKIDEFLDLILENNPKGIKLPNDLQFLPNGKRLIDYIDREDIIYLNQYIIKKSEVEKIINISIKELKKSGRFDLNNLKKDIKDPILLDLIEKYLVQDAQKLGFVKQSNELRKNEKSEFEKLCDKILEAMLEDISLSNSVLISEKFKIDEKTASNCIKNLNNRDLIIQIDERVWLNRKLLEILLKKIKLFASKNDYIDLKSLKEIVKAPRKILIPLMDYLDKTGDYINKDNKRFLKK
jgi:selenocysteine-specific elongation factor